MLAPVELPREFRVPRKTVLDYVPVAVVCFGAAIHQWQRHPMVGAVALGLGLAVAAGPIILLTTRLRFSESSLLVTSIIEHNEYRRADVSDVKWEPGKRMSIDVVRHGSIQLPAMGSAAAELHGFVRRWIATEQSERASVVSGA